MFCGKSNLKAHLVLGFIDKQFLIGISLTLPGSHWLVGLFKALAKAASRGLSLKYNVHDFLVISVCFLLLYIRTLMAASVLLLVSRARCRALIKLAQFSIGFSGFSFGSGRFFGSKPIFMLSSVRVGSYGSFRGR